MMKNEKILLIDDDEELCDLVTEFLQSESFVVEMAHDGEKGVEKSLEGEFNLIILDVMLPKINGFEVLRKIRKNSQLPVLMLTARGEDVDKIIGLELGADDYLPKPFNPRELIARIKAILRRSQVSPVIPKDVIIVDDVQVNLASRLALRGSENLNLTAVEFDLLVNLMQKAGEIVKRDDLAKIVLGRRLTPFDRSMDMHISNLRKKLGKRPDGHERIKTIRSVGYIYTVVR